MITNCSCKLLMMLLMFQDTGEVSGPSTAGIVVGGQVILKKLDRLGDKVDLVGCPVVLLVEVC